MQDIRGKRLLLLGSSVWKDLIKSFADYYGVRLYFAGLYPASLDDIVEEYYRIDTTDPKVMIPFIKEHQFDGIYMGGSEFIVSHACTWINQLGLPCYCEKEQWDILQDKSRFKDLCIEHGLPVVPKFTIDPDNISDSVPGKEFPVITKPTDGSGSNGFSVCYNAEELEKGYRIAAECSPTGSVICEKFVNNNATAVFYSICGENIIFCGTEDKIPVKYEKQSSFVAGYFNFPSDFEKEFRHRFEEKIIRMFKAIKLYGGSIWMEVFHDGDSFYFNEVGYRHGGSFSFYPINYLHNINQFYYDLYYALTGESKLYGFPSLIPNSVDKELKYCIYPIHCNAGRVVEEKGIDEVKQRYPNRIVVIPHKSNIGDSITETGSFSQIFCLFHFTYATKEECKDIIRFIQNTYKVIDTEGNNMVNVMLNVNDI